MPAQTPSQGESLNSTLKQQSSSDQIRLLTGRLAGFYALERLAQDNPGQRQTVVNVLCAYLRMPYDPPDNPATSPKSIKQNKGVPAKHSALAVEHRTRIEEREVRLTAQRILTTHLRPGPDTKIPSSYFWPDLDLDLGGAALIDFDCSDANIRSARFAAATFQATTPASPGQPSTASPCLLTPESLEAQCSRNLL